MLQVSPTTLSTFPFCVYRYDERLKEARKLGAKKGLGVGASLGGVIFTLFAIYGAVFWFGAYLITERITDGGSVLAVFFSVLIGALSLGQAFPNLQNLFEAAGAAGTIYDTIDRVSLLIACVSWIFPIISFF